MGRLTLVIAPLLEPVSVDDAKLFAKIDTEADDTVVSDLITSARRVVEEKLDRSLISQTWDYFLDGFPPADYPICLPRPPVISISSVKYTPNGGSAVTMSATDYYADLTADSRGRPRKAEIWLGIGKAWPGDLLRVANGVEIRYIAGYGTTEAAIPGHILLGIKQLIAYWYYNRSAIGSLPEDIGAVLAGAPSAFIYA
jgi:uncharacterized phiE125 gp8 family phage protein